MTCLDGPIQFCQGAAGAIPFKFLKITMSSLTWAWKSSGKQHSDFRILLPGLQRAHHETRQLLHFTITIAVEPRKTHLGRTKSCPP